MKLYRFSPIADEAELFNAIVYLHQTCHELCHEATGKFLPVSGNIGIFCHDYNEFSRLTSIRETLTDSSSHYNHKYFRLRTPIVIPEKAGIPGASYEFLYVRKVDPYRSQVGDIDFVLPPEEHEVLKATLEIDEFKNFARIFERPADNMIELWNPAKDVLSYLVIRKMADLVEA